MNTTNHRHETQQLLHMLLNMMHDLECCPDCPTDTRSRHILRRRRQSRSGRA